MRMLISGVLVLSVLFAFADGDLVLACRGKGSDYAIVTAANPAPSVWTAANELRTHIEQATGARLMFRTDDQPLPEKAIVLGPSKYTREFAADLAALGEEGFRIRTKGARVYILGSAVHGALFGAYEFLERFCGIGWYTSWHTVVPELAELKVPSGTDFTEKPAFEFRQIGWTDANRNPLFCARNKANMFGNRAEFGGSKHWFDPVLSKCHTFHALVPVEKYAKEHPEYFAIRDGKRVTEGRCQLCLTNPDVVRIATEAVLDRIRANPNCIYFGVSQEDGLKGPCQCDRCQAIDEAEGSPAATMILFVNQIAEAVEKAGYPDKIIGTLAYGYTRNPPKTVRPRDNVMIVLCSSGVEFSRPFADSRHAGSTRFAEELKVWRDRTKHLHLWDYTMNFLFLPHVFPDEMVIQPNLRFFRDCGVTEVYEQGAFQSRHAGFGELKVWLFAKLEWNPDQPLKPLLKRFFRGYYGKAAKPVEEIFVAYHKLPVDEVNNPLTCMDDPRGARYPKGFFEEQAARWDAALEAVKGDAAYEYNVRWGRFGNDLARVLCFVRDKRTDDAARAVAARMAAMIDESEKTDPMRVRLGEMKSQNEMLEKLIRGLAAGVESSDKAKKTELDRGIENIFGGSEPKRPATFADKESVVFFGDSITHNSSWVTPLTDFYLTRFPDRHIRFHNAGVGGDSAGGSMRRLASDVAPWKPTSMTVMFGMNDAGIANYATNATPEAVASRPKRIEAFAKTSSDLAARLSREFPKTKITWFAASPYDDVFDRRFPGAGAAVEACARATAKMAKERGEAVVDMNTPMTAFNRAEQKSDPTFTLCGTDGVHPQAAGGLFMAVQLLKAQGVAGPVSAIAVDAKAGRTKAVNATVSEVRGTKGGLTFDVREHALPYPLDPAARAVAEKIGFAKEFGAETLTVTGLRPGSYRLLIDGKEVCVADAAAFAAGVDLGTNESTPMMCQAREVAEANRAIRKIEGENQNMVALRHFMLSRELKDRMDDFEAVKRFFAENRDAPRVKRDYFSRYIDFYLENWPKRAERAAEISRREIELDRLRQPKSHVWTIVATKGGSR